MSLVTVNKNSYTAESLYQWDVNQVLEIRGLSLPSVPEIHFTNSAMDKAIVRQGRMDARGIVTADIPNSLLQKPYKITAFVCVYSGNTFETLNTIIIPVNARPKPSDYTIVADEEVYSFKALENTINNAIDKFENKVNELNEDTKMEITKNADFFNTRVDNLIRNYDENVLTVQTWDNFVFNHAQHNADNITVQTNGSVAKMTIRGIHVSSGTVSSGASLTSYTWLGWYEGVIPVEFKNSTFVINDVRVSIYAHMDNDHYTVYCACDGAIDYDGTITLWELMPVFTCPELIDARLGADGTVYDSVGDAMRNQMRNAGILPMNIQVFEINDPENDAFYVKPNMIFCFVPNQPGVGVEIFFLFSGIGGSVEGSFMIEDPELTGVARWGISATRSDNSMLTIFDGQPFTGDNVYIKTFDGKGTILYLHTTQNNGGV